MGSPAFAVPALSMLAERPDLCVIVGVVCQPDKPAGRGRKLTPCAVKIAALARGIPILEPRRLKTAETRDAMAELKPDIAVVAAYGRILPPQILELPPLGCINIHASLLPKYRGASPIAHAIMAGDAQAGVGIMQMEEGLDTGPVFAEARCDISADATCGSLTIQLAQLGAVLILDALPKIVARELTPSPQIDADSTYAPLLKKEDGHLDFSKSAEFISRRIRGLNPWPGCFTYKGELRLQVLSARVCDFTGAATADNQVAAGDVVQATGKGVIIRCGSAEGWSFLRLMEVKPAGKKKMQAESWAAGRGIAMGDSLA